MRTTRLALPLVLVLSSGCATPRAAAPGDVKQPTLLQRLGLGNPHEEKRPEDFVPRETAPVQLEGIVVPDEPTPGAEPAEETLWRSGPRGE